MRVSVLMPMRNAAPYVKAAIDSVLAYREGPLELIVMDDGSTDRSADVVRALGDPRIRLSAGPQRGISACLNAAWSQACGEVVMRCDADDLYTPGRIRNQLQLLAAHPDAIAVCGGFVMIDSQGDLLAEPFRGQNERAEIDITDELLKGTTRTHFCAYALRRTAVQDSPPFREYFETAEDIDFALRLAQWGRVIHTAAPAYRYRIHAPSITHTSGNNRREFFEQTARAFAEQRRVGGTDALQDGCAPAPPARQETAMQAVDHAFQLRMAECWRHFQEGSYPKARQLAWRNLQLNPSRPQAWRTVLSLLAKMAFHKTP